MKKSAKIGIIIVVAAIAVMLIVHTIVNRQDILRGIIRMH